MPSTASTPNLQNHGGFAEEYRPNLMASTLGQSDKVVSMHFVRQLKTLHATAPRRTIDRLRKLNHRPCRVRTVLVTVPEIGR